MGDIVANIFETGIYKAVEKAGGVSAMAKAINVSRQVVYIWLRRGYAPPIRAIQIEEVLGVPRVDLMDPVLLRGSLAEATRANGTVPYRPRVPDAEDLV